MLLRDQGVLDDAPGRGLIVAPMDPDHVRNMYDIRAMIEGLAFRRAAECNAPLARRLGATLLRSGREAAGAGSITALIAADLAFHRFIHDLSRNPLIAPTLDAQWTCMQRVMGEVLMRNETPAAIWAQHEAMLDAVIAADGDAAERLAREHITQAAEIAIERLPQVPHQALSQGGRPTRFAPPRRIRGRLRDRARRGSHAGSPGGADRCRAASAIPVNAASLR